MKFGVIKILFKICESVCNFYQKQHSMQYEIVFKCHQLRHTILNKKKNQQEINKIKTKTTTMTFSKQEMKKSENWKK